jgi:imidazolonepropionase-like amidohydrolase
MKPLEALQAATITPVKCLSMEDSLGSIEKGKIADLVLLNENPLKDIRNTRKIYAVILNGRYFSARKLHAMLQISPDAHE